MPAAGRLPQRQQSDDSAAAQYAQPLQRTTISAVQRVRLALVTSSALGAHHGAAKPLQEPIRAGLTAAVRPAEPGWQPARRRHIQRRGLASRPGAGRTAAADRKYDWRSRNE